MKFTDMTPKQVLIAIADVMAGTLPEVREVTIYDGDLASSVKIILSDGSRFDPWSSAADCMTLLMAEKFDVVHEEDQVAIEWSEVEEIERGDIISRRWQTYSGSWFPTSGSSASQMLRVAVCEAVMLKYGFVEQEDD